MIFLTKTIVFLNSLINPVAGFVLKPIASTPGWLSITIISAVTGILLMVIFKHTSNQKAIAKVRDKIKADMLALKLFRDSMIVTLQAEGRILLNALTLLLHALVPMLIMMIPVTLLLTQLSLWYQVRPLNINEQALVTVTINTEPDQPLPEITLQKSPSLKIITGPVKVLTKRQICWMIEAVDKTDQPLIFESQDKKFDKSLYVGRGFVPLSSMRPAENFTDILTNPTEKPFPKDSLVRSIKIDYPHRSSIIYGSNNWMIYFFIASMLFALIFKPLLKVRI